MTNFYLLCSDLRAVAHVLRYAEYIHDVTGDCDFPTAISDVVSDYLYYKSDELLKMADSFDEETITHEK